MITCQNCDHQNLDGTLFCSECGVKLTGQASQQTARADKIGLMVEVKAPESTGKDPVVVSTGWGVAIRVARGGAIIPLVGQNEFIIGRDDKSQSISADIDLSPYGAQAMGVSRMHLALKILGEDIMVCDLNSSNGSYLNGQKMEPGVDYPVKDGAAITLGKLQLQLLKNL